MSSCFNLLYSFDQNLMYVVLVRFAGGSGIALPHYELHRLAS